MEETKTVKCPLKNERANWHPYALSMCPTTIAASLEESEDVTTACQVVDANVALRSTAVRVQTIYQKDDTLGGG